MGTKAEELSILKKCLNGEKKAQKLLYQTYADNMFAVCLRYSSSSQDAEDILQEGFIKVFDSIKGFRCEGSLEGWLRKVFINCALEHRRRFSKWDYAEDAAEVKIASSDIGILQTLSADDLLDMVKKLPAGYNAVFNLFVIEGYSHKEIANKLGVSESTSKTQLFKARFALQEMIKKIKRLERREY